MTYEYVWAKVQEFAVWFFNFAMNEGENKFMLADSEFVNARNVSNQMMWMFLGSFVVVALIAILSSDSFHPFALHEGIFLWFKKISVLKVTIFAASVFSLHTFYKMLITIVGNISGANASVLALECLGTYINPLSLCIFSIAVSTLRLQHRRRQAFFLGLSVFLTPALLTFNTLTVEHIVIYSVGLAFGIVAAFLYQSFSIYTTYIIMSAVYLVSKFFLIFYSSRVMLLTETGIVQRLSQFMACMELDMVLILLISLILLGYKEITLEAKNRKVKKDLIGVSFLVVFMIGSIVSNKITYVYAETAPASPVLFSFGYEKTPSESSGFSSTDNAEQNSEENYTYQEVNFETVESSSHLVSSRGNEYHAGYTLDNDLSTCWQDGANGTGEGEFLLYNFDREYEVGKIRIANGNRKSFQKYQKNCRLAKVHVYFYNNGNEVKVESMQFEDSFEQEFFELYTTPVQCDSVKIVAISVYPGSEFNDLCVSEVEIYEAIQQ